MLGWVIFDLAFIAAQYRTYGYITDSIGESVQESSRIYS